MAATHLYNRNYDIRFVLVLLVLVPLKPYTSNPPLPLKPLYLLRVWDLSVHWLSIGMINTPFLLFNLLGGFSKTEKITK